MGVSLTSPKKRLFVVLSLIIFFLTSLLLYHTFYKDRVLVIVGDYEITHGDKNLRDQIQWIFYPRDPRSYGLDQLTTAFTYAQILKNNGHEITEAILRAEEVRINQNTKASDVLKKIRDLFQGDEEAYKKVFILPTYAERTIYYEFFNKNPKVQEASLKKVREVLDLIEGSKSSLQNVALTANLVFKEFTLSKEKGLEWKKEAQTHKNEKDSPVPGVIDMSNQPPAEVREHFDRETQGRSLESAQFWINNIIKNMKPGEVFQAPVDYEDAWVVVKYARPLGKEKYQMEAVFIPKANYQQWLEAETAKVQVKR